MLCLALNTILSLLIITIEKSSKVTDYVFILGRVYAQNNGLLIRLKNRCLVAMLA